MKKKLFIISVVLFAFSSSGDAEGGIANIITGDFIPLPDATLQNAPGKNDEPMVLYHGDWIPASTYDAFQDQIAFTEITTAVASREGLYRDLTERNEWEEED